MKEIIFSLDDLKVSSDVSQRLYVKPTKMTVVKKRHEVKIVDFIANKVDPHVYLTHVIHGGTDLGAMTNALRQSNAIYECISNLFINRDFVFANVRQVDGRSIIIELDKTLKIMGVTDHNVKALLALIICETLDAMGVRGDTSDLKSMADGYDVTDNCALLFEDLKNAAISNVLIDKMLQLLKSYSRDVKDMIQAPRIAISGLVPLIAELTAGLIFAIDDARFSESSVKDAFALMGIYVRDSKWFDKNYADVLQFSAFQELISNASVVRIAEEYGKTHAYGVISSSRDNLRNGLDRILRGMTMTREFHTTSKSVLRLEEDNALGTGFFLGVQLKGPKRNYSDSHVARIVSLPGSKLTIVSPEKDRERSLFPSIDDTLITKVKYIALAIKRNNKQKDKEKFVSVRSASAALLTDCALLLSPVVYYKQNKFVYEGYDAANRLQRGYRFYKNAVFHTESAEIACAIMQPEASESDVIIDVINDMVGKHFKLMTEMEASQTVIGKFKNIATFEIKVPAIEGVNEAFTFKPYADMSDIMFVQQSFKWNKLIDEIIACNEAIKDSGVNQDKARVMFHTALKDALSVDSSSAILNLVWQVKQRLHDLENVNVKGMQRIQIFEDGSLEAAAEMVIAEALLRFHCDESKLESLNDALKNLVKLNQVLLLSF